MSVPASSLTLVGTPKVEHVRGTSARGTEKVMSACADCGSTVFGGRYGVDDQHTVYAGTLDDGCVGRFEPTIALFVSERPAWAKLQIEMKEFDRMPGMKPVTSRH